MTDPDLQYTISDARYAKNMVAIAVPGIGGWKSLAAMILTTQIAPRVRWSSMNPEPTSWDIVALRVVSALFLAAYGLRLCEAYYLHIGFWPLLPYTSAWVSWICLARWQWHPVDWRKYQ